MDKEDVRKWVFETLSAHCGTGSNSPSSVTLRHEPSLFSGEQCIQLNYRDKQYVMKIETLIKRGVSRRKDFSRFAD